MNFILATNPNDSSGLIEAQNPENSVAGRSLNDHTIQHPLLSLMYLAASIPFLLSLLYKLHSSPSSIPVWWCVSSSATLFMSLFQSSSHWILTSCAQSLSRLPRYFHSSLFSSMSDFCSSSDSICTTRSIVGSAAVCVLICLWTFALRAFETNLKLFLLY